jgi:hypothetical protein
MRISMPDDAHYENLSAVGSKATCVVKIALNQHIFNEVLILSEMNYDKKGLPLPTNRYFQLHSTREFGFM